jgi:hypothetical protein
MAAQDLRTWTAIICGTVEKMIPILLLNGSMEDEANHGAERIRLHSKLVWIIIAIPFFGLLVAC